MLPKDYISLICTILLKQERVVYFFGQQDKGISPLNDETIMLPENCGNSCVLFCQQGKGISPLNDQTIALPENCGR